jgi:hypothetical protein
VDIAAYEEQVLEQLERVVLSAVEPHGEIVCQVYVAAQKKLAGPHDALVELNHKENNL